MPQAIHIANWIVQYRAEEMAAPVDPMSLEKLIYYAQAFHLSLFGGPIFDDAIEAWTHGPVVPSVYFCYRPSRSQPIDIPAGNVAPLSETTEAFLREVVSFFGGLTALRLSDATHQENPWKDARRGLSRDQKSDTIIQNSCMREYYSSLMEDGEFALSRQELLSVVEDPRWGAFYVAGVCIRKMTRHPFYQPILAKKLQEPVETTEEISEDLYAPIGKPEYMDLGDIKGLTSDEIIRRVHHQLDQ